MKTTIIPPPLSPGDEIRIVAPASVVEKDYINKTFESLKKLGYNVSLGKYVFSEYNQFAGTDWERTTDFQNAVNDPDVKAVFCARGGYGSIRIADKIDYSFLEKNSKWIAGFSDITIFHSLLNCKKNLATLHSPMPVNFDCPRFSENLLQIDQILKEQKPSIKIEANPLNRKGRSKAKFVGGNLSILYSLQSTPLEIDTQNKILFIEDVGEQLYHLDRMMNNFLLSGKLAHLNGLIVGGMTDMVDKKQPFGKTAYEIVYDVVKFFDFPVAFGFPAGHTDSNVPFILGTDIILDVNDDGALVEYP
jgi:muramoyltetrapeptide carboxypeptidase